MRGSSTCSSASADSDASVLVTGESGTGKELVARALHRRSGRRDGPFVAINCAALPETLLESELFGHDRGAFTDARTARDGPVRAGQRRHAVPRRDRRAAARLQPKLLRALQEREVRPVGGERGGARSTRAIIAATNRDLETRGRGGPLPRDLFYRLNVIQIDAAAAARPRQRRPAPRPALPRAARAAARASRCAGISPAAAERLLAYAWPGNVRELQNCIERAVALARYDEIAVEDLPESDPRRAPAVAIVLAERRPGRAGAAGGGRAPLHPARPRSDRRQQVRSPRESSASTARRSTGSSSATGRSTTATESGTASATIGSPREECSRAGRSRPASRGTHTPRARAPAPRYRRCRTPR